MELKSKRVMYFIFGLLLFMLSTNMVYANSMEDSQGRVKEYHLNEKHSEDRLKSLSLVGTVDSEKSYVSPDVLSSNINKISNMYFYLSDSERNIVSGIKVNKIEIFQNEKKIASTNNVKSYSVIGQYKISNAELLESFSNPNGENKVDIVFYLFDKEVARIENYTLKLYSEKIVSDIWPNDFGLDSLKIPNEVTILNGNENDLVNVWLEDENGDKVTDYNGLYDSTYNNDEQELMVTSKLSFKNDSYLDLDKSYKFVVEVNAKRLDFVNVWNDTYIDSDPMIYVTYSPDRDGKYYYRVGGVNLLTNGPYKLDIEQDGKVTGSIGNITANLQDDNFEMINEDITDKLDSPGEQYIAYLYDKYGTLINQNTWLEPLEIEEDVITPSGMKEIKPSSSTVGPSKVWTIKLNGLVNEESLKDKIYITNSQGISLIPTCTVTSDNGFSKIEVKPAQNYTPGDYILWVRDIESVYGTEIKNQVYMKFTVEE